MIRDACELPWFQFACDLLLNHDFPEQRIRGARVATWGGKSMGIEDQRSTLRRRLSLILLSALAATFALAVTLYIFPSHMGTLLFALLAGGMGAGVSLARGSAGLGEAELNTLLRSPWNLAVVEVVAAVMAGIVYLLFLAGILTGDGGGGLFTSNLFPKFSGPTAPAETLLDIRTVLQIRPASIQDFGKLVIWCFVAGYSDKFAPNILGVLENRASNRDDNGEGPHT